MTFVFRKLSFYLKEHPLVTNMVLSSTVAFWGDIVCQTIYEPASGMRPPLTMSVLPPESAKSILLIPVSSPYVYLRSKLEGLGLMKPLDGKKPPETVLIDLRRSFIFCSFTLVFGVPFFLESYRRLDKLIPSHRITKKAAICKGLLSWIIAQFTNPIFLTYVTAMDHFFIFRDGRDGRRRVEEVSAGSKCMNTIKHVVRAGESTADTKPLVLFSWTGQRQRETRVLLDATDYRMGNHYRYVENKSFNIQEYTNCVYMDSKRKLINDFPDILRYGIVFWGVNWLPMFYYIPSHFRLAYSAGVQVVWSGIMSHLLHRNGIVAE